MGLERTVCPYRRFFFKLFYSVAYKVTTKEIKLLKNVNLKQQQSNTGKLTHLDLNPSSECLDRNRP